jgi:hypothetical protein
MIPAHSRTLLIAARPATVCCCYRFLFKLPSAARPMLAVRCCQFQNLVLYSIRFMTRAVRTPSPASAGTGGPACRDSSSSSCTSTPLSSSVGFQYDPYTVSHIILYKYLYHILYHILYITGYHMILHIYHIVYSILYHI